jgi:signal peptidase I|tara:strand:+ start:13486 stop:14382 length:897 start_codon:yes stop_codon:yes gene_type:complete
MFTDPIFLLALVGVGICLSIWVLEAMKMDESNNIDIKTPSQDKISKIGFALGLVILYRVFINAGDLSIILLLATIISLIIWLTGKFTSNSYLGASGRGWFIPIFLIFVLRTFMYEPYQIPSGSMIPGLKVGDFILVNKHSYGLKLERTGKSFALAKDPKLGDVVVFIPPHKPMPFVKRLIGKPGDKVSYINKKLYLNDKPVPQSYYKTESGIDFYLENFDGKEVTVQHMRSRSSGAPSEWIVPEGMYFAVGDNRDNSNDSRYWGFIPRDNFMGTADYIWMTWECWSCMPSFKRAGSIK